MVAIDFFTVPTATFKILYVFLVLSHDRRRVVHFNVTDSPTGRWTALQIAQAFPYDTAPRFILRDRDSIYGEEIQRTFANLGIDDLPTAPRSPWQNAYVERLIGSIRRECLDRVVILSEMHLRRVLREYLNYYEGWRTHLGLAKDCPEPRAIEPPGSGEIVAMPQVGGLHRRYTRRLAPSQHAPKMIRRSSVHTSIVGEPRRRTGFRSRNSRRFASRASRRRQPRGRCRHPIRLETVRWRRTSRNHGRMEYSVGTALTAAA
ncbi:MAG: integrase core domain-containing protein [bacterium]